MMHKNPFSDKKTQSGKQNRPQETQAADNSLKMPPAASAAAAAEKQAAPAVSAPALRSKAAHRPLIVFVNFIFMLAVFLVIIGAGIVYGLKYLYQRPDSLVQAQQVTIPPHMGVNAIADMLRKQSLINNAAVFVYGSYLENKAKFLKAGEYAIPAGASMRDIADILVRGRAVQYSITFPEGLTVQQIFAKLTEESLLTGDLPPELPPEGTLMTDTVKFVRGTARRDIVRRLAAGQARLVDEIWQKRAADLPLKSKQDMVILASVIEKETGIAAERPLVAAVFYNRLKKNMRLQSDPTVLYGLFGGKGRPADRPIYRSDLEKETPYNTYKIIGLPPTPICNPGRDSLLAAANPPHSDDLYFVASGAGGHIFAKTLSEHNENVAKWRLLKQERQNSAAPALEESDKAESPAQKAGSGGLIKEAP